MKAYISVIFLIAMFSFSSCLNLKKTKCLREGFNCLGTNIPCCDGMECIFEGLNRAEVFTGYRCGIKLPDPIIDNTPKECVNKGMRLPGNGCSYDSDCCYNICDLEWHICD